MHKFFALLLLVASSAVAQNTALWISGGGSVFTHNGLGSSVPNGTQEDVTMEGGLHFAVRASFDLGERNGHELQYVRSRARLESHLPGIVFPQHTWTVQSGGYNFLIYSTPRNTRVRPFLTGGAQFTNYLPPTSGPSYNKLGLNYGGGLKIRVTKQVALRFDIRQYTTPKPLTLKPHDGWILQNEFSGGVGWVF